MKMVLATFPVLDDRELNPLLKKRPDLSVMASPLTQEALLRQLDGAPPDVLLLSSTFPGNLDPESFRQRLRQGHPALPIVHLLSAGRQTPAGFRDHGPHAMLRGPLQAASLRYALDEARKAALTASQPATPAALWAVYAPSPGAGTSRLAVDLWQALWSIGLRPAILADLHPTAPDLLFRVFPKEVAADKRRALEDALEQPQRTADSLLEPPGHAGLRLLPGIWNLEEACRFDEEAYGRLLASLGRLGRAVVVDTAPPLQESSTFTALSRADHLLIPLPNRPEAVFHFRRAWRLMKELHLVPDSVTLVPTVPSGEATALGREYQVPLLSLARDGKRRRNALIRFLNEKTAAGPSPTPAGMLHRFLPFRGGIPFAR